MGRAPSSRPWIGASAPARVCAALRDPKVLDARWTLRSSGQPEVGETYRLFLGDSYDWRATVSRCEPGKAFELTLTRSDERWNGSRVAIDLVPTRDWTHLQFAHRGWPGANDHDRASSSCRAMYLRLMKRHLETGEQVQYAIQLDVQAPFPPTIPGGSNHG